MNQSFEQTKQQTPKQDTNLRTNTNSNISNSTNNNNNNHFSSSSSSTNSSGSNPNSSPVSNNGIEQNMNNSSNGLPQRPKTLGRNFFSEEKRNSIIKELECIGCKEKVYPNSEDGYELIEFLGEGTEGKVWKAVCKPLKTYVAIKIINLIKTDTVLIKDVIKEARLMNQNNHVNLIHYHTSFLDKDNSLWLVMDYLAGGSLADIVKYKYPNGLPEALSITVLKSILKALVYLHHNHKIHRDLKSDNILIGEDGEIELSDFGVCAELERKSITARKTIVGTPCWMAPEIISEKGYNEKIDIWSLGITAIELVRGKPPGSDLTPNKIFMNLLFGTPPSLQEDTEHGYVTLLYKDFVEKCLQRDPEKRPSASKLLDHKLFKHAKKSLEVTNELCMDLDSYKDSYNNNNNGTEHATDVSPIRGQSPPPHPLHSSHDSSGISSAGSQTSNGNPKSPIKRSPSDSRLSKSQAVPGTMLSEVNMPRASSHPVNLNDLENNHLNQRHHSQPQTGINSGQTSPTTPPNSGSKSPEKERKKSSHGIFSHIRRHSIAKLFSSPSNSHKPKSPESHSEHHHFHFPFSKHHHHHSNDEHVETN
ncbi:putative protein serine/threonine kinase [Tieghemostelium lacteum]|uniref:Protein kinase domain-containing protein n=1 Tax=Tieghemostelium lacteum TaxID=361077 RepID=A0A152A5A2_TIELA|nr:putative protein serine/threonine kinase [Tieghemostelium lacteum]|eukprot:KYR01408.1 putative protein serine/threonine kinase [Tieghemostelium lacteum]